MKVIYDGKTDTLDVILTDTPAAESDEDKPGVILDYDALGNLVSLEILDASRRVGLMTDQEEFYPMPFFATLTVSDVEASTRWYVDVLGFRLVFSMPGPNGAPTLSHLRWMKYADLLLVPEAAQPSSTPDKGAGVRLSFLVSERTVDELAEQVRARGGQIAEGPLTQPWNTREFTVLDPDGYTLTLFQQADDSLTFDQVVQNAGQP